MKKSTKRIIISSLTVFVFVTVLGFGLVAFNNQANNYDSGVKTVVNTNVAQNQAIGNVAATGQRSDNLKPVLPYKVQADVDLKSIPAPKEGESPFLEGEKPENSLIYVGPEDGDTNCFDNQDLVTSNNNETNGDVYWGVDENGTLTLDNHETEDASNKCNQSGNDVPEWHEPYDLVKNVIIASEIHPLTTKSWFSPAEKAGWDHSPRIKSITNLGNIKMNQVVNASYMFTGLNYDKSFQMTSIPSWGNTTLDLSNLKVATGMFAATGAASGAPFNAGFTGTQAKFTGTASLTSVNAMFQNANFKNDFSLDMSELDVLGVSSTNYMFNQTTNLMALNLGAFDGSKITSARTMFGGSQELKTIDMTKWSTSLPDLDAIVDYKNVFRLCPALKQVIVSPGFDWSNVPATKSTNMFKDASELAGSDNSTWETSGITTTAKSAKVDYRTWLAVKGSDGTWETSPGLFYATTQKAVLSEDGKTLTFYLNDTMDIISGTTRYAVPYKEATEASALPWNKDKDSVEHIVYDRSIHQPQDVVPSTNYWFDGYSKITDAPMPPFSTSIGQEQYKNCDKLETFTVTSKVEEIGKSAFDGCQALRKVVVGDTDVFSANGQSANIKKIDDSAFANCPVLENFVIRTSSVGTDGIDYGANVFTNSGSTIPTVAAPIIFSSSADDTKTKTYGKFYEYQEVSSYSGLNTLASNKYYFTTKNITWAADQSYALIGGADNQVDCVLDLNGKKLDRNLTAEQHTLDGNALCLYQKSSLRVDDTKSLKKDEVGSIVNANTSATLGSYAERNHIGGGIFANGTLSFVNGAIRNCHAREGGAIAVSNEGGRTTTTSDCGMLLMYHGYLEDNSAWFSGAEGDPAACGGGAIMVRGNGRASLYNGEITHNVSASKFGAGVFINMSAPTQCNLFNINIHDNSFSDGTSGSVFAYADLVNNDCTFTASKDAVFTLETGALKGCPLYDFDFVKHEAKIVGHKAFAKYTANIPKTIANHLDLNKNFTTTGISSTAFNGDTNLKKLTIENSSSTFVVDGSPFNGCTGLETYVVKDTVSDNITYNSPTPFTGIGTNDPTVSAPFIIAAKSGGTTSAKIGSIPFYNYNTWGGKVTSMVTLTTKNQYYCLTSDASYSNGHEKEDPMYCIGNASNAVNIVMDLNHHTVYRNAGKDGNKAAQCIYISKDSTLRIDDTSGLSQEHLGKITGGNTTAASTSFGDSNIGGGVFIYGTCNFVNGRITGNKGVEGGGIANGNPFDDPTRQCLLRMYNGYIDSNTASLASGDYGGGAIMCRQSSNTYIYGGHIINNHSATPRAAAININNGRNQTNKVLNMRFYLFGGEIKNNTINDGSIGGIRIHNAESYTDIKVLDSVKLTGDNPDVIFEKTPDWRKGNDGTTNVAIPVIKVNHSNKTGYISGILNAAEDGPAYITGTLPQGNGTKPEYEIHDVGDGVNPIVSNAHAVNFLASISNIKSNAFANNTDIRKIVIDSTLATTGTTICTNAFVGTSHLENFVVVDPGNSAYHDTFDSKMVYQTNCFNGAGYRGDAKAGYVKFIIGGGATTQKATPGDVTFYKMWVMPKKDYKAGEYFNFSASGYYVYLKGNLSCSKDQDVCVVKCTGVDSILDLAGYTINRNQYSESAQTATDGHQAVLIQAGSSIRIDNSNNLCTKHDSAGQIRGGNTLDSGGISSGIYVHGSVDYVNANTCYNKGGEGAGLCCANCHNGPGHANIFGGIFANNTATRGGALSIKPGGTIDMYGGKIIRNTATDYGGAVYIYANYYSDPPTQANDSKFCMYGGTIGGSSSNDIENQNVAAQKGSVFCSSGSGTEKYAWFYMSGKTCLVKYNKGISGNNTAGIYCASVGLNKFTYNSDVDSSQYLVEK